MNRLLKFLISVVMVLVSVLFCASVYAEKNPSSQGEVPYFSNKDIEQYKTPYDNKTPETKINRTGPKEEKAKEKREQQDQEYWCKKATSYRRKIEKGRDEISEIETKLSTGNLNRMRKHMFEEKLSKAKKRVVYLEKDMSGLEEEARRKNIPPGWLRCQFE